MATKTQRERESLANKPVTKKFADNVLVNAAELAESLRVSRWTVGRWRERGYKFLYGRYTTSSHAKSWLKEQAELKDQSEKTLQPEDERMKEELGRLR
jgi:hypothetical protein